MISRLTAFHVKQQPLRTTCNCSEWLKLLKAHDKMSSLISQVFSHQVILCPLLLTATQDTLKIRLSSPQQLLLWYPNCTRSSHLLTYHKLQRKMWCSQIKCFVQELPIVPVRLWVTFLICCNGIMHQLDSVWFMGCARWCPSWCNAHLLAATVVPGILSKAWDRRSS